MVFMYICAFSRTPRPSIPDRPSPEAGIALTGQGGEDEMWGQRVRGRDRLLSRCGSHPSRPLGWPLDDLCIA